MNANYTVICKNDVDIYSFPYMHFLLLLCFSNGENIKADEHVVIRTLHETTYEGWRFLATRTM